MGSQIHGLSLVHQSQISIDMGGGVSVQVDLTKVNMTDEQRGIVARLLSSGPAFTTKDCSGDDCPASARLSKDDFEKVRGLKATLGTGDKMAGLVCDFCMKCVAV